MKIIISKNKDGNGYYTKVQNDYNGKHTEKYLSLQIPKGTDLEYGLYDVDGFLSTYEKKDGNIEFKLVITDVKQIKQYNDKTSFNGPENDPNGKVGEPGVNPFEEFGKKISNIEITPEDLPF